MAVVYEHIRKDTNEVFYVGIGNTDKRAFSKHGRNKYWKHIVEKVGYSVNIIINDATYDEAKEIEKYLIAFYGRKDMGLGSLVNMTDGGDGVVGVICSNQTRQKLSAVNKGDKHYNFGKPLSDEQKQKLSEARKGKTHSEETIQKIINNLRNRKNSKGYYYIKDRNKYRVKITLGGKQIHLGEFNTPSEAEEAYKNARIRYFA
jgi:hypothetical protein